MVGNMLKGIVGAAAHLLAGADDKLNREFRKRLVAQRSSAKESSLCEVTRVDFMSIVVEEMFHSAHEHVILYGDDLPAYVFLTPNVRAAMRDYLARNSKARITVLTNEFSNKRNFLAQLAESDAVAIDASRVTLLPLTAQNAERYVYRLVLADTKPAPSLWFWNSRAQVVSSRYQFYSEEQGRKQAALMQRFISEFGSPP